MDPLSITAGILAVLGAGGKVGQACKNIRDLKYAPHALFALNNEVADLDLMVQDLDDHLRQYSQTLSTTPPLSVSRALNRTKATLVKLEELIAYELETPSKSEKPRLDKSTWLRAGPRIQEMIHDIRADRVALASILSLLSSSLSLRGAAAIQRMSVSVEDLDASLQQARNAIMSNTQGLDSFFQRTMQQLQTPKLPLRQLSQAADASPDTSSKQDDSTRITEKDPPSDDPYSTHWTAKYRSESLEANNTGDRQIWNPTTFPAVSREQPANRVTLARSTCILDCACSCHKRIRMKSPSFLNTVLGSMFLGYQPSPRLTQSCDNADCRQRCARFRYTYIFPSWLLKRIILVTMAYTSSNGPELCLRVMRIRPPGTRIACLISNFESSKLDHSTVKNMLRDGETSVLDVFEYNESILNRALRWGHLDIAKTLIRSGADPYFEDLSHWSPFTIAWNKLLARPSSPRQREEWEPICQMLGGQSDLRCFGFSNLHKACLGMGGILFDEALSMTQRSAIDDIDSIGRTTLSWACQRQDVGAINQLLLAGADPNKADFEGRTPMHWSVSWGDRSECAKHLLAAKADPELKDKVGSTALHRSVSCPRTMQCLIDYGVNCETQDNTGARPLHYAVMGGETQSFIQLLRSGVDINACDDKGNTPLHDSIRYWSHSALETLLDEPEIDTSAINKEGHTVLHHVAVFGNTRIVQQMHSAALSMVDTNALDDSGSSALDHAEWRIKDPQDWSFETMIELDEDSSEWYDAFIILMTEIRHRQGLHPDQDTSDAEDSNTQSLGGGDSDTEQLVEDMETQETWEDALEVQDTAATT